MRVRPLFPPKGATPSVAPSFADLWLAPPRRNGAQRRFKLPLRAYLSSCLSLESADLVQPVRQEPLRFHATDNQVKGECLRRVPMTTGDPARDGLKFI